MSPDFKLTEEEEKRVVASIEEAEKQTSGEVRIHIERVCKKDPLKRAKEVFAMLKMHKTELRNGVLLYISTDDHKLAIFGDKGINDNVPEHFWNDTLELLINHFKSGNMVDGLCNAISMIGDKLKEFFPYQSDDDNELDNTISYHEN